MLQGQLNLNGKAAEILYKMLEQKELFSIDLHTLENGCRLIDAGINCQGSWEAGRGFAEATLGGTGNICFQMIEYGDFNLPGLSVTVNRPVEGCLAAQYAGWSIQRDGFFAMGSGPARCLSGREELFKVINYQEKSSCAVLALEGRQLPQAALAAHLAEKCGIDPQNLWLIIAPTASLAGSIQVSARVVETGLHKMKELGFDVYKVLSGMGCCPVAPVAEDDGRAIGRTNDCVLYGGDVYYTVSAHDSEIEALIERMPSSASREYGEPFYQILKKYNWDFYAIDPLLFSPARVVINNLQSGRIFRAGSVDKEMLRRSMA